METTLTKKLLVGFGFRHSLMKNVLFIAMAVGLIGSFFSEDRRQAFFILAGTAFIAELIIEALRYRLFRCPCCRKRLPTPEFQHNRRICFFCRACKIEWDTGLVHYVVEAD